MSKTLKIADGLTLPVEVVTQTVAIVAKRRAGKSYTMRRVVEQLMHAGQQIVLVDPKGDQWGLRSSADGKGPGLPIVILGGERADVPLEVGAGEMVAKLAVEERVSILLDLSLFRKAEIARFMTDFLETVYRLKAREIYRTPLMLVIDEADAIAPQKPQPGEERMLGAAEDIVRRGGQRGLGCILVTQRTAVLNKNVLTQAEMLVALRTIAPQDLAAMSAWIDVHGEPDQKKTLMASLPALPVGDAWFWSPGWPTADGIFKRVHVLPIETFDSGATPKPGEKRVEPKTLADVDLDAVKRQMAETIERAKADDPKELKKTIATLQKSLQNTEHALSMATAGQQALAAQMPAKTAEILSDADRERLAAHRAQLIAIAEDLGQKSAGIVGEAEAKIEAIVTRTLERLGALLADQRTAFEETLQRAGFTRILEKLDRVTPVPASPAINGFPQRREQAARPAAGFAGVASRPRMSQAMPPAAGSGEAMPPGEKAVLTACAMYADGVTRDQLGVLTGYKRSSRDAYLQRLGAKGWVESGASGWVRATDAGVQALGADFEPLPTGQELLDWWRSRLPSGERAVLDVLVAAVGEPISRDAIDEKTGFKRSSRDAYLQRLASRRLVETVGRGEVRASAELFG